MKCLIGILSCLLLVTEGEAAEIVAWKVPLSNFAFRTTEPGNQVHLKSPPEILPFLIFGPGDDLWDVLKIPKNDRLETDPPMEWAVWNATTSTLVTKCDWNAIWQLNERMGLRSLPTQCRMLLEAFEVPTDGSDLSDQAVPACSLTWIARSGQESKVRTQADGRSIQIDASSIISENNDLIDLKLKAVCLLPEQPKLEIETALTLRPGQSVWLARDSNGTHGMDLRITAQAVLMDGTPRDEMVRIQQGNHWKPFVTNIGESRRRRINNEYWLITTGVGADLIKPYTPGRMPVDPFAKSLRDEPNRIPRFPVAEVPEILRPWFSGRVLDMRSLLDDVEIKLEDGDFAGFDSLTEQIFLFTKSAKELDKFEALFSRIRHLRTKLLGITQESIGASRLVTRSGQRASMVRTNGDNKDLRRIEIEPVLGEREDLVDLQFFYDENPGSGSVSHFNLTATLTVDKPLEIQSADAGKEKPIRVKAEILRP